MDNNKSTNELIEIVKNPCPKVRDLKKALSNGADLNFQSRDQGDTAIMYAVRGAHDRVVEYLLRQGANPLLKNHDYKKASDLVSRHSTIYPILKDFELLFATNNNDLPGVKLIIESGALVNFQGPEGYYSLMIAVEQEFIEVIEYLLLIGADLTLTRSDGKTVFDLVSDVRILKMLENAIITNIPINKQQQFINKNKNHFFRFSENKSELFLELEGD